MAQQYSQQSVGQLQYQQRQYGQSPVAQPEYQQHQHSQSPVAQPEYQQSKDGQPPAAQPQYHQPQAAPSSMVYQSNSSNQQLNEKTTNHSVGGQWNFSYWDCCSPMDTCCMAYWCPCFLFGRTQERNQGEENPSGMGIMCCAWYGLALIGGQGILQAIQRNSMRKQYGIEGSGCMDCLSGCCCPCCGLMQEEKESLLKNTGINPVTKQQYHTPQGMMHP